MRAIIHTDRRDGAKCAARIHRRVLLLERVALLAQQHQLLVVRQVALGLHRQRNLHDVAVDVREDLEAVRIRSCTRSATA